MVAQQIQERTEKLYVLGLSAYPLQWMIYILHLSELPFRHIFEAIDGPTTSQNALNCYYK